MLLTFITFIIVLGALVFAHEIGHFFVARRFGVKCDEFGFGFPPRICGLYKNHHNKWRFFWGNKNIENVKNVIYSLNLIPLGGFVKIKGIEDFPGEKPSDPDEEKNSFAEQKIWKRVSILSAGVFMNVILAGVLISIGMMIGMPQVNENLSSKARVSEQTIQIFEVLPDTPAAQADLKIGDIILGVNGQAFNKLADLQDYTDQHLGETLNYKVKRLDQELEKEITPVMMTDTQRGGIGVAIAEIGIVRYPWYLAIFYGFKSTLIMLWAIIIAIFGVFKGLLMGQGAESISGPVGIATMTGQMARMGFVYILQFTAILSLNLAILNFLPIPALDGGRVLFLLIEKLKGKPVKKETEAMIHNIGFLLLMLLIVLVTFKDINSLGCFSCKITELWNSMIN